MIDYDLPDSHEDTTDDYENITLGGDDLGDRWSGETEHEVHKPTENDSGSIEMNLTGLPENEPEGTVIDIYHLKPPAPPELTSPNERGMEVFGDPSQGMDLWDKQDDPYSCAVAVTNSLFRSLDLDPGEELLRSIFQEYGIYDPLSGTNPFLIDDVLNDLAERMGLGLRAQEINNFTESQLKEMIQQDKCPLIAIDAHNLYPECMPPGSGHAVQLTSIITKGDQSFAVINDPGYDGGAGIHFPMETFLDAAHPFSNTAIILRPEDRCMS